MTDKSFMLNAFSSILTPKLDIDENWYSIRVEPWPLSVAKIKLIESFNS
jgi:hypothetical protein